MPQPDPANILVVDDDLDMLALMAHALRAGGYRVRTSSDAIEARKRLAQDRFELVVCDILMPGLSGRTFGQQIAEEADPPLLVFVSAADALPGSLPGAFLKKPFRPEALLAVVREMLKRRR